MKTNKTDKVKNRRQFLINTSLAALGIGVLPKSIAAKPKTSKEDKSATVMCDKTTLDYYGEGPFYTDNPPMIENSQLAVEEETGTRMIISGRVMNLDCNEVIPNTLIDVWHANDGGDYDNTGYNLRGQTLSNDQGFYIFETIKPGKYLNGNQFRPSHIHFKITPPNFPTLTTQLYFDGDEHIAIDAAASIDSGEFDATHRIITLETNAEDKFEGTWDIVINGDGVTGVADLHIDKGMIYSITPNPSGGRVEIKYGVFKTAKVTIQVFDINGQLVANLEENNLTPEKYIAVWEPEKGLPNGHYFVTLKVNDLQVHYLKMLRQRS